MGVAEVGGPVPSPQRGMEEIDSKFRSILLIIVIYGFMCDKFGFFFPCWNEKFCFSVSAQVVNALTCSWTETLDFVSIMCQYGFFCV